MCPTSHGAWPSLDLDIPMRTSVCPPSGRRCARSPLQMCAVPFDACPHSVVPPVRWPYAPEVHISVMSDAAPGGDDQGPPQLSDVGRVGRYFVRRFVAQARAFDQPTFRSVITDHLGVSTQEPSHAVFPPEQESVQPLSQT